ncbi:MAG: hypothetical protein R3A10_01920 [Caldilineaceae bacterium]
MATLFKRRPAGGALPGDHPVHSGTTSPYLTVFDTLAATLEDRQWHLSQHRQHKSCRVLF